MNIIEAANQLRLGKKIKSGNWSKAWNNLHIEGKVCPIICHSKLFNPKTNDYSGKQYSNYSFTTTDLLENDWEVVE